MDSYVLYDENGASPLQLGSWLRADPGPDFGFTTLRQPNMVMTPYSEGALAFEQSDPRTMRFPLLLGSNGAWSGLEGLHSLLHDIARPGAYIDLQPEGVPSAEAVRFDVLSGRLLPEYVVGHQRVNRRNATLELITGPYGYWPTWTLLASAASIGLPAQGIPISINAASVWGDAPALGRLVIAPTVGTSYPYGTWMPDMVAWSLAGRASQVSFWPAASLSASLAGFPAASLIGDAFAPGSQNVRIRPTPTPGYWQQINIATVGSALEPAYRGRFRAFAYARVAPSGPPVQFTLDAAVLRGQMLASAQQVATINPGAWAATYVPQSSPGHALIDLGEITLPPVASGLRQTYAMRLWAMQASPGPSTLVEVSGLQLLPMDGAHGVLTRGLAQPTSYIAPGFLGSFLPTIGRFDLDAYSRRAIIAEAAPGLASANPINSVLGHHHGDFPIIGASTVKLDFFGAMRRLARDETGSYPQVVGQDWGAFALYRMEESAGPTLADYRGSWHGSYAVNPGFQGPGAVDFAPSFNDAAVLRVASIPIAEVASSFSLSFWYTHSATGADVALLKGNPASPNRFFMVGFDVGGYLEVRQNSVGNAINFIRAADINIRPTEPALVVANYQYGSYISLMWAAPDVDGGTPTLLASNSYTAASIVASGHFTIGNGNGATFYAGMLDEVTVFQGTALGLDSVGSIFYAKASPPVPAPPSHNPLTRTAPAFAAYSLLYRPRFTFLKGI